MTIIFVYMWQSYYHGNCTWPTCFLDNNKKSNRLLGVTNQQVLFKAEVWTAWSCCIIFGEKNASSPHPPSDTKRF